MRTTNLIVLAILLFAGVASADAKISGHMLPLDNELLQNPVKLNCGVTITEWRGYPARIEHANALCDIVLDNFEPFLNRRGISLKNHESIEWRMALLPTGNDYRALNDLKWRFKNRTSQFPIWGYTDNRFSYSFMLGNSEHREFDVTFVHESFHAFSMWSGVFDEHANTWNEKVRIDEILAEEFTQELGFGR